MEVAINASMTDQATSHVADALRPVLEALSNNLNGNYGGVIEHLWIDVELIESHAKADGSARFPFRLQRRVSGQSHFVLPAMPDAFNVGHFSVRPDFKLLPSLPANEAIRYTLSLIYRETAILCTKRRKLGGFDADGFRLKFRKACQGLGYPCEA